MNSLLTAIVTHGDTIVVGVVAIALGWDRFFSGTRTLRKEIAEDYRERNAQLEQKLKELSDNLNRTNIEMAGFKATIIEKDKRIAELREDLQLRNPNMLETLKEIRDSNKRIKEFMEMMHNESLLFVNKK